MRRDEHSRPRGLYWLAAGG